MKILITNGAYKHALCAIRSLGKKGYTVGVVAHHFTAVGFYSKYCQRRHIIPTLTDKDIYIEQLLTILKKEKYDVLLPIGYPQTAWIAEYVDKLKPYTRIPIANWDKISTFQDKEKTQYFAQSLAIPTPKTYYPTLKQENELDKIASEVGFPAVIKYKNEGQNHAIIYVKNKEDLKKEYALLASKRPDDLPIIQQYLEGEGVGFFALYDQGVCKQFFMHRRVREYPVSGGSSSCAVSIYDEKIKEYGLKILDAANWQGVAMVEFKYDKKLENTRLSDRQAEGKSAHRVLHLLEVNPKFWGSLDLSETVGVGFVEKTIYMAMSQPFLEHETYETDVEFSWLFDGDLQHGIETGKAFFILKNGLGGRVKTNLNFTDFLPTLIIILKNMPMLIKSILTVSLKKNKHFKAF